MIRTGDGPPIYFNLEDTHMLTGKLRKIVEERGFGFIDAAGTSYFMHVSGLAPGLPFHTLREGDMVTFDVEPSDKGPRATDVRLAR